MPISGPTNALRRMWKEVRKLSVSVSGRSVYHKTVKTADNITVVVLVTGDEDIADNYDITIDVLVADVSGRAYKFMTKESDFMYTRADNNFVSTSGESLQFYVVDLLEDVRKFGTEIFTVVALLHADPIQKMIKSMCEPRIDCRTKIHVKY